MAPTPLPANTMQVHLFREILIWPLAIKLNSGDTDMDRAVDALAARLYGPDSPWQHEPDLRYHLTEKTSWPTNEDYAETVFFHKFIRKLLFPDPNTTGPTQGGARTKPPPIQLFKRSDIIGVELKHSPSPCVTETFRFPVDRLSLYLFETGVLLLVLELASPHGLRESPTASQDKKKPDEVNEADPRDLLTLAQVQTIVEQFRRVYPAYWKTWDDGRGMPAASFARVTWLRGPGEEPLPYLPPPGRQTLEAFKAGNAPTVFPWWRDLLAPLNFDGDKKAEEADPEIPSLYHVMDERIPTLSLIGVEDAAAISDGDWIRIAYADAPGSDVHPYGPDFLKGVQPSLFYDRFWHGGQGDLGTRYCCSGYAFSMVGRVRRDPGFCFFRQVLQTHFRRHYFQLGLIAHAQRASVLSLSTALADAVVDYTDPRQGEAGESDPFNQSRTNVLAVRDRILSFTQRFWFSEVSNQVQPRELFHWWVAHLGTHRLFQEMQREAHDTSQVLDGYEQQRMAKEQHEMARTAERLNRLAGIGVVLAVSTGFLGMNIFSFDVTCTAAGLGKPDCYAHDLSLLMGVLGFFSLLLAGVYFVPRFLPKTAPRWWRQTWFVLVGVALLLAGAGFAIWIGSLIGR